MYYLLNFKLKSKYEDVPIQTQLENTYLLLLDGDVIFEAEAVFLLADLLRRDISIGGTCGRINPKGSGKLA